MNRYIGRIIPYVISIILVAAAVPAPAQPNAAGILKRSYAAEKQAVLAGHIQTTLYQGSKRRSSSVRVFRDGRRSRMDYMAGRSVKCSIIDDGKSMIRLQPSSRKAYVSRTPEEPERLDLLLRNYKPVLARSAKVAGRPCRVLRLEPRYDGNPSKKLWVDRKSGVVLRTDRYDCNGKLAMSTEYRRVDFSKRPPASAFAIPRGWKLVRLTDVPGRVDQAGLGFSIRKPTYIPKGYVLDGHSVCEPCGSDKCLGLRYTNGLNTVSVFQMKCCCSKPAKGRGMCEHGSGEGRCTQVNRGQARMLSTSVDGLTVVIVGDLPTSEIRKMAKSIR